MAAAAPWCRLSTMKTKSGETIPRSLATRLQRSATTRSTWNRLCACCQREYAELVRRTDELVRSDAVARVLELMRAQSARHGH
jgi:hypothetical protein